MSIFPERFSFLDGRDFERRPQQETMASKVYYSLSEGLNLCVEAPTGVGKSIAYLLPAVKWHRQTEQSKPIIITTHTKHLQEQLLKKDVPAVQMMLGDDFNAVIGMGRGNYICMRRMNAAAAGSPDFLPDESMIPEVFRIKSWADTSENGCKTELPFAVDNGAWGTVNAEEGNCLNQRCPHFKPCFFQKSRRALFKADIIIVNHALFFSDLAIKAETGDDQAGILPSPSAIIVDECHTVEDVAAVHLGIRLSAGTFLYQLRRIYNKRSKRGAISGISDNRGRFLAARLHDEVRDFFQSLHAWLPDDIKTHRIHEAVVPENPLAEGLTQLCGLLEVYADEEETNVEKETELRSLSRRLLKLTDSLSFFLRANSEEHVFWFEKSSQYLSMHAAAIDVAPILNDLLFRSKTPVITTSATLAVGEKLKYFRSRVGMSEALDMILDSPFDFKNQMKVFAAQSVPSPKDKDYEKESINWLRYFIHMTNGGAFVLFTSFSQMKRTADAIRPFMTEMGLNIFVQGEAASSALLLEAFKEDTNSVLFGTDTFWTGVDVPGETLRNVIIMRIPFSVPDHPLIAARCEHLEKSGGRPFFDFSIPEAELKLRQGIGRLIRTAKDRGIVVLMDSRVSNTNYGGKFLRAMPEGCEIEKF
ncbi:ATP-dependent DNA helicase [Lentisphaera profundi]|uniref:DNA 5'-3' helicase n=1 Tax=Lentisphaera profundi TaxID=1658616 RepID=A0ABY7VQ73_9BACT|nr:ATP-dependent DNA helicase [Lentisphaera profundi]WDE95363.1 ATP-dependent DNA helicase [Lentisphaera profundi]